MKWYTENSVLLPYEWLCAFCVEELAGFDPDMGDDVDWHPGKCEKCGRELIVFTPTEAMPIEYVGHVEGLLTVPMLANGGIDREGAMTFNQYYGSPDSCEMQDENCSADGNLWGVGDMGSPYFCTSHYFPQEQLGYEFIVDDEPSDDVCDGDEITLPNGNRGCTGCAVEFDKNTGQVV